MKGGDSVDNKQKQDNNKRKRKNQIIIRCSDDELLELNKATEESGLSRTDFFLSVLHNGSVIIIEDLQDICIELKKQGVNLNQSLRFAYQYGDNTELMKSVQNCNNLYEQTKNLCIATESKAKKKRR